MTRPTRVAAGLLVVVAAATFLTGCKKQNSEKVKVDGFITATEKLPRAFTYIDDDRKKQMSVVGVVGDTFRYKARLAVNGVPTWEEVVADDAIADRFDDPHVLVAAASHLLGTADSAVLAQSASVLDAAPAPVAQGSVINSVDVLRTKRWLLDKSGAPTAADTGQAHPTGEDPIYDAVTALEYTRRAADAAVAVVKYDPEALQHPYKATEDPFPTPATGSGISRYDLVAAPLPQRSATGSAAAPTVEDFRKMAIYVKGGLVIEVREAIDVLNRLPEFARNEGFDVPKNLSANQQIDLATQQFDRLVGVGGHALRVRTMTLRLLDLGTPQQVTLPTDNVVEGSASVLPYRGKTSPTKAAPAGPGVGFTTGPTTTTP